MALEPNDWLSALADLKARGEPCVLVTLADIKGSAPRESGTKLVITAYGLSGSIGGGPLEFKATEIGRAMLRDGTAEARLETLPLGPAVGQNLGGQSCEGKATLLFEPFVPADFTIALFGAGHVGKAIVGVLAGAPARVLWIDGRAEQFPAEIPPNVTKILSESPADEVKAVPRGAYALVMTHTHDLDFAICERLLTRGDCRYVGMIGSAGKRRTLDAQLARKGVSEDLIRSLHCPIGLPGLTGRHPREIAIAVAAELLGLRDAARRDGAAASQTAVTVRPS